MMHHYTYQTKNLVNGKTYIGMHTTSNLDDGYKGSGVALKSAIKKYGKDNFCTTVLAFFDTREEAFEEEKFLVNVDWVKSEDNYNLWIGGQGNTFTKKQKEKSKAKALEVLEAMDGDTIFTDKCDNGKRFELEAFKKRRDVLVYDLDNNLVISINGVREASRRLKIGYRQIQRVLRGERQHTNGLKFKYETK